MLPGAHKSPIHSCHHYRDPKKRLGHRGAGEVKFHPFFEGIDWSNLAKQKATFIPQPDGADDTSYFQVCVCGGGKGACGKWVHCGNKTD